MTTPPGVEHHVTETSATSRVGTHQAKFTPCCGLADGAGICEQLCSRGRSSTGLPTGTGILHGRIRSTGHPRPVRGPSVFPHRPAREMPNRRDPTRASHLTTLLKPSVSRPPRPSRRASRPMVGEGWPVARPAASSNWSGCSRCLTCRRTSGRTTGAGRAGQAAHVRARVVPPPGTRNGDPARPRRGEPVKLCAS